MKEYTFYQVDVFTDRPFGGNPLAVFPDAEGITDTEMQRLAIEMNLSETTFVLPPSQPDADFRVRIFTPGSELPFAGHPVIGTHWVLAHLGRVQLQDPVTTVRFEMGIGVLPADLHVANGTVERVVMTQGEPRFIQEVSSVARLCTALGLPPESISKTWLTPEVVSTGLPQLMVPTASLAAVQAMKLSKMDVNALNGISKEAGAETVLVYCTETVHTDADVHVRVFAPLHGIPEDPATGSANGALAAYLVKNKVVPAIGPTVHIQSEQGIEMGRESILFLEVDHDEGIPRAVRVGGTVAPMIEGTVRF